MIHSLLLAVALAGPIPAPFTIEVVDDQTGRGVPLVELRTVNGVRSWTDSAGIAAISEPGLADQPVYFHVSSHGYEFPKDGFGYRGKALDIRAGGSARLKVKRLNVAERLYRVTGEGIYRDSVLAGRPVPLAQPLLNARVLGSDSVLNAIYREKLTWFWGDTNRPGYPLGNFQVPGATSRLPADGGLDPARGVDLTYYEADDGFARPTCAMPGPGPTWIDGLFVLKERNGDEHERLFAGYVKIKNFLDIYERGLVEFDPAQNQFKKVATFDLKAPNFPHGHPFPRTEDGVDWIVFANPYPLTRVRARAEDLAHPERYESYTCLAAGSRLDDRKIDRAPDGAPRRAWKADTPALRPDDEAKLVKAGLLKPHETLLHLRDVETGKPVSAHAGSIAWNEYRRRWVMVTVQQRGSSFLGEVWYAEADTPIGPWVYARKVVTHERYSFYNPKQHPYFAQEGGRLIYFEGTYAQTFSGNPEATPRYDYNQMMYRLDLDDARLNLPVAVYHDESGDHGWRTGLGAGRIAFYALERPIEGAIPILETRAADGTVTLSAGNLKRASPGRLAFLALPPDAGDAPASTTPLFEYRAPGAPPIYATQDQAPGPDYRRAEHPLCLVWPDPRATPPRD